MSDCPHCPHAEHPDRVCEVVTSRVEKPWVTHVHICACLGIPRSPTSPREVVVTKIDVAGRTITMEDTP